MYDTSSRVFDDDDDEGGPTTRNTKVASCCFRPNLLSQRVDAKVCQYTVEDRDATLEMGLGKV